MSHTPASIAALISHDRYNAAIVPSLEDYLAQQVKTDTYDYSANRHLLSFYLSNPDMMRHDMLKQILVKSLAALPQSHFLALSYRVPLPLQQQDPYKFIFRLYSLLESGQFRRFWLERNAREKEITAVGFDEHIRAYITVIIGKLYTRVSMQQLVELLNIDRSELEQQVAAHGWSLEDGAKEGRMVRISKDSSDQVISSSGSEAKQPTQTVDNVVKVLTLV